MNDLSTTDDDGVLIPSSTFQDSSTDCAICLEPFDEDHHRVIITLGCGHKWHFDCLVQQLQTAQPSSTTRLLFTGCQCAKCGVICEHPDLKDLTRTTDVLRQKVDQLLREQVALDAPDVWKRACCSNNTSPQASKKSVLDHARRKYAFYLCSHCKEPYFGGTVECADLQEQEQQNEERLCVACAPQSQICCRNPLEHGGYLVWKCRYCCQPSTHLCYGNVHFCNGCHERNSERVRQQQQQQQQQRQRATTTMGRSSSSSSQQPPPLEAIPCSGSDCPFPKPENQTHHSNGPSSKDSEQVYGCAWCQSSSDRQQHTEEEPGSHNLLSNPSGQHQLQGWRQLNPRMSWKVERSELPVNASTTTNTNFVSSFLPCMMSQSLDLSQLFHSSPSIDIRLEISARYMGRTDCPSTFRLEAMLMDRNQRPLQRLSTQTLEAPPDYWERTSLIFERVSIEPDAGAQYLHVIVIGKDTRFWQGYFGSKVAECSVRVLGSPEHVASVLLRVPPEPERQPLQVAARNRQQQQQQPNILPRQGIHNNNNNVQREGLNFREVLLPIVCFVILAWLAQS